VTFGAPGGVDCCLILVSELPHKTSERERSRFPTTHRLFLERCGVTAEEIRKYETPRPHLGGWHVALTFSKLFAVPWLLYFVPGWWTGIACALVMLHVFHCLSQIIHASDHGDFLGNKQLSAIVGDVSALFLGFSRRGHAASHNSHHVYLNTDRDPDRAFLGMPSARSDSLRHTLRQVCLDLLGWSAIRRLIQYQQTDRRTFDPRPWRQLDWSFAKTFAAAQAPVAVVHCALLAYYAAVVGALYYFLFYVLPLFTLYSAVCRLRYFVEHSLDPDQISSGDGVWMTRSTHANFLERLLVAPLEMPYHFEHHLIGTVPYYNLRRLHKDLASRGVAIPIAQGYASFLWARWLSETACAQSRASPST
jgi:fatty acid desaturase